jgi:hypothetical protein
LRIAGYIQDPKFRITVFTLDDKYMVQLEAGLMVQSFKIGKEEVKGGIEAIEKLVKSDKLYAQIYENFNKLYVALEEAKK